MCLECSELKYLSVNSKTQRQVHFWSGRVFASFSVVKSCSSCGKLKMGSSWWKFWFSKNVLNRLKMPTNEYGWYFRCPKALRELIWAISWTYKHFWKIEKKNFFQIFWTSTANFGKDFLTKCSFVGELRYKN